MKRWLLLALGLTALGACSRPESRAGAADSQPAATAEQPAAATQQADTNTPAASNIVYVDVRTPEEFAAGHVQGAINIPYDQMPRRWTELQKFQDRHIIVYCRTGHRAGIALQEMKKHGFAQAINGGGLQGLAQQGVPVTGGP